ncbi:GNAT family N-acetyltransferase [Flavobacterium piscinae]|uniref:N-acetyltransferase n=1 Tax=Flavobacterium piscinae TaxID=2506424 RepID=A0A4Q1KKD7_9FLAO|nr:GNAT family N-acetyltransferase [Flavobacterium piscinae]MBC8882913.1 GNAT family N-acetyltransferase [Flavobacterium piscinae]RXR30112.1 N-acetyltransferase [Flavobacterium piscinae]
MESYYAIETERLQYRKLTKDDIPLWSTFFENNDRIKFLGVDVTKKPNSLAKEWIEMQFDRYEDNGLGHLAIILKETKELIGLGGIIPRDFKENKEFEIAYSLFPKYWGKGYATEHAIAMKNFGFKNIDTERFISIIDVDNFDSEKVARKNKMEILFKTEHLGMNVNVFGVYKI